MKSALWGFWPLCYGVMSLPCFVCIEHMHEDTHAQASKHGWKCKPCRIWNIKKSDFQMFSKGGNAGESTGIHTGSFGNTESKLTFSLFTRKPLRAPLMQENREQNPTSTRQDLAVKLRSHQSNRPHKLAKSSPQCFVLFLLSCLFFSIHSWC